MLTSMTNKKDMTLTSVKVQSELFEEFKVATVRYKFSLQKLTDRAIHLYLTDENFRKMIHSHTNLEYKEA
jgi:hypothetical protein